MSTDQYLHEMGERLRLARARRGMTRQALARQSGLSLRYIAQMEGGKGNVSILLLRAVAQALGVRTGDLLPDTPEAVLAVPHGVRRADHIALIGLRGAGKSSLGGMLAARLGVAFFELDREIERDAGMALREIFELHGQAGFRRMERAALERLLAETPRAVIAAGGGIVADAGNFELLLSRCRTIWIRAAPGEHMQRVIDQGDLRPMQDNRRAMDDLQAILASREALYARADLTLDTSGHGLEESFQALVALVG